jgi:hypothetical protein
VPTEWNGDWSDGSAKWRQYPEVAKQLGYTPLNDGLFWISWEDFTQIYDTIIRMPKTMSEPRGALGMIASIAGQAEGGGYA